MNLPLFLLASYALVFLLKESPLTDRLRIFLIGLHPLFYALFSCYFCLGFHCGWMMYLLYTPFQWFNFFQLVVYALSGASGSYLISVVVNWLETHSNSN